MARLPTRPGAFATAAVCALLAVWLWDSGRSERTLQRANEAGLRGDYALAAREAGGITRGVTASRAHGVRAYAYAAQRKFGAAAREFRAALDGDPQNWRLRRDLGRVLLAVGDRRAAQAQMARALALNPRMALPAGFTKAGRVG